MSKKITILVISAIVALGFAGCKKGAPEQGSDVPAVKSMAEYEAEAEKEITADNMESELEKLESEISADEKALE